jgi:DNA-binding transcriptional regulator GbsR (MarR family)
MTETKMDPLVERFVLHWGEMGTKWGINRTVAQVHALLYLAKEPLNAEDLVDQLGVARSNVSTSLRELQGWGIVRVAHKLGDRRDHFESTGDVWEMFRRIMDERKRREIDPTLAMLRELSAEAKGGDPVIRQRIAALTEFFSIADAWYQEITRLPQAALVQFLKLGGKIRRLLGLGKG